MRTRLYALAGVLLVGGLVACARTHVTSLRAPDAPSNKYHRTVVALLVSDLGERRSVEDQFAADHEAGFVQSYAIIFPGRQYSNDELLAALVQSRADAILVISLNQAGVSRVTAPVSTSAQCTAWSPTGGCVQATAITTGGYDIAKPWASFTVQLADLKTGKIVWVATSQSRGNAFAKAHNLLESMAGATIDQLRKDGMIP